MGDGRGQGGAAQAVAQRQRRRGGGGVGAQPPEAEAGGLGCDIVARRGRGDDLLDRLRAASGIGTGAVGYSPAVRSGIGAAQDEIGAVHRRAVHGGTEGAEVEGAAERYQAPGLHGTPDVDRGDAAADQADGEPGIRAVGGLADELEHRRRRVRPEVAVDQGQGEAVPRIGQQLDGRRRGRDGLDRVVGQPGVGFLDVDRVAAVRARDEDAFALPCRHGTASPVSATREDKQEACRTG